MKQTNSKRVMPPIHKQTAFELMFGWSGTIEKVRLKPLKLEKGASRVNGVRI